MRRILPNEVQMAISNVDLKPVRWIWWDQNRCCAITALCLDNKLVSLEDLKKCNVLHLGDLVMGKLVEFGFDQNYLLGFSAGFDGERSVNDATAEFSQGFDDGVLIREKLFS